MRRWWLGPAVVLAMVAFSAIVFARLPERVPSHWNLAGEIDGTMDRFPGAFFLPAVALVLWALLRVLPRIDPRRAHYERFQDTYRLFVNVLVLFFAAIHVLMLGVALGWPIDVTQAVMVMMGVLFIALGNYFPRIRSNWWMGIRTPWTLESERVWRETHRLGGRTFIVGGVLTIVSTFLPAALRPWVGFTGLALAALVPAVYSYFAWRREKAAT